MIYLYSGTPGSGKSLHLSEKIYYRIKYNKPVIANFYYNTDLIRSKKKGAFVQIENHELRPDFLINYALEHFKGKKIKEGSLLLVIDECQLLFNARDWQQSGRNEWLSFFSQHRKFGYDIVLVAQFDRMIDRQIRSLVEYEYVHRKVSNYGSAGKVISLFALGNLFVCVKVWYPMKEKVGSEFFIGRKKYFEVYDSYNIFNS